MQQAILSKLQANKWEERLTYLYTRGAHGLLKEGAPSGWCRAAKCGRVGCHLSTLQPCVKQSQIQGEGTISFNCGLPPQEGATSPRGSHLFYPMCSYLPRYSINQVPIKIILSPLTPFWLWPFNFLQPCPPLSFLFLTWLIFIELKWLFWVFESKINFEWWKSLILLK